MENTTWTKRAKELTKKLHEEITLNNYNWHKFRANKKRRSAELIISAMSQLMNQGKDSEVEELLKKAIEWIKEEIKDTGCETHKS